MSLDHACTTVLISEDGCHAVTSCSAALEWLICNACWRIPQVSLSNHLRLCFAPACFWSCWSELDSSGTLPHGKRACAVNNQSMHNAFKPVTSVPGKCCLLVSHPGKFHRKHVHSAGPTSVSCQTPMYALSVMPPRSALLSTMQRLAR